MLVGGHLGGHLIEGLGVGVDNTAFEVGPLDWLDVGPSGDASDGSPHLLDEVERGPATLPQPRYEVREREGRLEVRRFALARS